MLEVKVTGGKKLEQTLKKLAEARQSTKGYDVGFFKSSEHVTKQKDGKTVTQPTAYIAAIQEFGAPEKNIPERPFFRQANKKVEKILIKYFRTVLSLKNNYVINENEMRQIALKHEGVVKERITDLREPPNAPATIKAKSKEGKTSDNPLIDTGQMRQAVIGKVVK